MPNLIFNSIISIIIFFSSVGVLLREGYISPKYIRIKNVISINNTKTDSPRSRNSLLIYTDKITYRSSCLGLSKFCNRGQKTKFNTMILIEYLLVADKSQPEGIILKIIDTRESSIIFENDYNSIKRYLNGVNRNKNMFLIISLLSLIYLFLNVKKIFDLR